MNRIFAGILCCALLTPVSTGAMMLRAGIETIARSSDDVVEGKVVSRASRWNDDQTQIITEVEVYVIESWADEASSGRTLTITTRGGVVGDIGERVEHQPLFVEGEPVLLFLQREDDGSLRCAHDIQGKFAVGGGYVVGLDQNPIRYDEFRESVAQAMAMGGNDR